MPVIEPGSEKQTTGPKVTGLTKVDRVNRWLTLGANIGVVLGLIIVIAEMRQNAAISRTAMEMQANAELREIQMAIARPDIAEIWMKSIHSPETLSNPEVFVMEGILVSIMLQMEQRFQMAIHGVSTQANANEHVVNLIPFYFGSRFGKQWWTKQTAGWEGSSLIEVGNPIVEAVDENFMANYFASIKVSSPSKLPPQSEDPP